MYLIVCGPNEKPKQGKKSIVLNNAGSKIIGAAKQLVYSEFKINENYVMLLNTATTLLSIATHKSMHVALF